MTWHVASHVGARQVRFTARLRAPASPPVPALRLAGAWLSQGLTAATSPTREAPLTRPRRLPPGTAPARHTHQQAKSLIMGMGACTPVAQGARRRGCLG